MTLTTWAASLLRTVIVLTMGTPTLPELLLHPSAPHGKQSTGVY